MVTTPLLSIGVEPLRVDGLVSAVSGEGDGAVVSFLGLVRNHNAGRRVRYLEYEAYEPLALKVFERIAAEARERWSGVRFGLQHRIGHLEIGEASDMAPESISLYWPEVTRGTVAAGARLMFSEAHDPLGFRMTAVDVEGCPVSP